MVKMHWDPMEAPLRDPIVPQSQPIYTWRHLKHKPWKQSISDSNSRLSYVDDIFAVQERGEQLLNTSHDYLSK